MPGLALLDANVLLGFAANAPATASLLQSVRMRPRSFAVSSRVAGEYQGLTGGPVPRWLATYQLPASCAPAMAALQARFAPAVSPADLEQLAALHDPAVACVVTSDEQMRRASDVEPRLRGRVHKPEALAAILAAVQGAASRSEPPRNPTQAVGTKPRPTAPSGPRPLSPDVHDERRYGYWKGGRFYLDE